MRGMFDISAMLVLCPQQCLSARVADGVDETVIRIGSKVAVFPYILLREEFALRAFAIGQFSHALKDEIERVQYPRD